MTSRIFCVIFRSVYLVQQVRCGHKVGFATFGLVSHHRILWNLGKELQTRGHKFTHIWPSFAKETYDDVDVKIWNSSVTRKEIEDWYIAAASLSDIGESITVLYKGLTTVLPVIKRLYRRVCEEFLKQESLMAELKASVDLVLCDVTSECCFILVDMLNATRVDVSTGGLSSIIGVYLFDYPLAPAHVTLEASILLPDASKFSFFNRLNGFLTSICLWHAVAYPKMADIWEKIF